uniref:SFRICE_010221 n=1 Tax=Spodoptera frugiperda TaxID=7108 RepID=A0A2H1V3W9_SPOFR
MDAAKIFTILTFFLRGENQPMSSLVRFNILFDISRDENGITGHNFGTVPFYRVLVPSVVKKYFLGAMKTWVMRTADIMAPVTLSSCPLTIPTTAERSTVTLDGVNLRQLRVK